MEWCNKNIGNKAEMNKVVVEMYSSAVKSNTKNKYTPFSAFILHSSLIILPSFFPYALGKSNRMKQGGDIESNFFPFKMKVWFLLHSSF